MTVEAQGLRDDSSTVRSDFRAVSPGGNFALVGTCAEVRLVGTGHNAVDVGEPMDLRALVSGALPALGDGPGAATAEELWPFNSCSMAVADNGERMVLGMHGRFMALVLDLEEGGGWKATWIEPQGAAEPLENDYFQADAHETMIALRDRTLVLGTGRKLTYSPSTVRNKTNVNAMVGAFVYYRSSDDTEWEFVTAVRPQSSQPSNQENRSGLFENSFQFGRVMGLGTNVLVVRNLWFGTAEVFDGRKNWAPVLSVESKVQPYPSIHFDGHFGDAAVVLDASAGSDRFLLPRARGASFELVLYEQLADGPWQSEVLPGWFGSYSDLVVSNDFAVALAGDKVYVQRRSQLFQVLARAADGDWAQAFAVAFDLDTLLGFVVQPGQLVVTAGSDELYVFKDEVPKADSALPVVLFTCIGLAAAGLCAVLWSAVWATARTTNRAGFFVSGIAMLAQVAVAFAVLLPGNYESCYQEQLSQIRATGYAFVVFGLLGTFFAFSLGWLVALRGAGSWAVVLMFTVSPSGAGIELLQREDDAQLPYHAAVVAAALEVFGKLALVFLLVSAKLADASQWRMSMQSCEMQIVTTCAITALGLDVARFLLTLFSIAHPQQAATKGANLQPAKGSVDDV